MSGMHPQTLDLYCAVAAHMPEGISSEALRAQLHDIPAAKVTGRLSNLSVQGYLKAEGMGRGTLWRTTQLVPKAFMQRATADADDSTDALFKVPPPPSGVPRGVANSVFALGSMMAGAVGSATETVGDVLAEAGATVAAVTAPAAAPKPAHAPAAEPASAAPGLGWVAAQEVARADSQPRFELHSEGILVIDPAGDGAEPIALTPTVTRALFRWLDRIGGLQLADLVEEAAA